MKCITRKQSIESDSNCSCLVRPKSDLPLIKTLELNNKMTYQTTGQGNG